jgi:phosphatidylserine synthase
VTTLGAWAVFVMAILLVFNALSFELYFILCLIGFLVITQMSGPRISRPQWRSRVNLVIIVGVVVFIIIVTGKVLDILHIRLF